MKKWITVLLVLSVALSLAGCGCEHEWAAATCVNPSTCTLCGETEGVALGHVWMAATCEAPKTCETCAATEGEAKGHAMVEATCEEAKHCENCNLVEGEALGHSWLDATTEEPQTCELCALTEGERIITDFRFTTESTRDLQGEWAFDVNLTAEMIGDEDFEGELPVQLILNFGNDGNYDVRVQVTDQFMEILTQYTVDGLYAEFAQAGLDKETVDKEFQNTYAMTVHEFVEQELGKVDFNELYGGLFRAVDLGGVYYVNNGMLYTGANWKVSMQVNKYTLEGDTLIIDDLQLMDGETFERHGRRLVTE